MKYLSQLDYSLKKDLKKVLCNEGSHIFEVKSRDRIKKLFTNLL